MLRSERTAKYLDALVRHGPKFDYSRWLAQIKRENTQPNPVTTLPAGQPGICEKGHFSNPTPAPNIRRKPPVAIKRGGTQPARRPTPAAIHPGENGGATRKSIRDRLANVSCAWADFEECRDRDAVYGYLRAVYCLVRRYVGRRRKKRLVRRAFQYAGLPVDANADPFAVVIRATCDREKIDNKVISKWSRALRYVAKFKNRTPFQTFIKNRGGINACAALYAEHIGHCN
jgi:hypothetical protein